MIFGGDQMQRLAISLLLVVGVLLVASPAFAQEISLVNTINPLQGGPGTEVTLSGSGAWPDQNVTVTLTPQAESSAGAWLTLDVVPDAAGTFSTVLAIPADMPAGVYFVRVEQTNPERFISQHYWNTFTVGTPAVPPAAAATPAVTTGEAPGELPQTGGAPAASGRILIVLGLALLVVGLVGRGLYALVLGK
jgi:hypothetical protein